MRTFALRRRHVVAWAFGALFVVLSGRAVPLAQQMPAAAAGVPEVRAIKVQPNFYVIVGAGSNIGVQIGEDGVVLVDAGTAQKAAAVLAVVKTLSDRPIRYIVNTTPDADHVAGNEVLAKAGVTLFPGGPEGTVNNSGAAAIVATEQLYEWMSAPGSGVPGSVTGWPTETFTRKQKTLYLNDEGIQVMAQPGAHADGDAIVLFRRSDVIFAGDVFDMTRFPAIDFERGGRVQGEIDALNRLIELTIPATPFPWRPGGTQVVPGHGRISDQPDLVEYRDMVVIVRDRVQDMLKSGMSLDQIKKADLTKGFTNRYGSQSAAPFVEAIYKSLIEKTATR